MADQAPPLNDLLPIQQDIEINADIKTVWERMSGDSTFPRWFTGIRYKRQVGAKFYMQPDDKKRAKNDIAQAMECVVEAVEPMQRLQFSWGAPGKPQTIVVVGLKEVAPKQTLVRLRHSGWDQFPLREIQPLRDEVWKGYRDFVLPALKSLVEGRAN